MFSFKSIYFVIFTLILYKSRAEISDKRLCIDQSCSEVIAIGKTLLKYNNPDEHLLSFAPNEDVKVYSYGAGTRPDLIGVEIKGRRGYIPLSYFKETNRLKRPKLLVDTKVIENKPNVPLEGAPAEIKANPTQQPFEIVDGTRIPLDIDSFSTEAPVVNVVGEQSSKDTTKSLDSVPDNQNVTPAAPREPNIVNIEQNKNDENSQDQQQQQKIVNKYDDESDDADVEDEDDEIQQQSKLAEPPKTESPSAVDITDNQDNSVVINNTSNDNFKSKEGILDELVKDLKQKINTNNKSEEAINGDDTSGSGHDPPKEQHKEVTLEKEGSTANKMKITSEYVAEIIGNLKIESAKAAPKQPDGEKTIIGDSLPLANINAIHKPEVKEFGKEASDELINKNVVHETDSASLESENEMQGSMQKKTKESKFEEPFTAQLYTTEATIDIEIPPKDFALVTPNPNSAFTQDMNSIGKEESNNDTEDGTNPEFKKPEEVADIKVEEKPSGGLFGGLRKLPFFSSGDNHEVGEAHSPNIENEVPEENIHNNQSIDSESSDDLSVSIKPDDFDQHINSEQLVPSIESKASENASETEERSLPHLNSEEIKKNNMEEGEKTSIEKPSETSEEKSSGGILSNIITFFGWDKKEKGVISDGGENKIKIDDKSAASDIFRLKKQDLNQNKDLDQNPWSLNHISKGNEDIKEFCETENCPKDEKGTVEASQEKMSRNNSLNIEDLQILVIEAISSDLFLYLTTTALSVIFLLFGMVILDKCRREGPLIARINKLEQQLMTTIKENEMLQDKSTSFVEEQLVVATEPNEVVEVLKQHLAEMQQEKLTLEEQIKTQEEQIQALEKELDTSTEVGIELNKIISEMLNSSDGSEIIKENIEQMQKKLFEQQDKINSMNETLSLKETENYELRLEMEISNRKVTDLQTELDALVEKILKIEDERDQQHSALENEIIMYQTKCKDALSKEQTLLTEIQLQKQKLVKFQRISEVKIKEYNILKESLNEIKAVKNNKDVLKSLLEVSEVKAQLEQLNSENTKYSEQLTQERDANVAYETKIENFTREVGELREKYQQADREKVEINTKLQVLNNYFKEKEDQMQKEISKYESLWAVKEGEATSTTERIRYMQEELQNYRAQNESLKQEIVNQEVELKSQISMLEKKAHESWVANRQTERKLEEAKQEAAQLRNRLTLRERAIVEGINHNRIQSPLHQNGELPISPPPIDPTQSPPPLFNPRDHLAKSPPIPGMPPPPFLPPPLGATPFIPPPPLDGMMPPLGEMGGMPPPHFMPPLPPGMFPGDHRPPPLGRMSSPPPASGRYTPDSTLYSDYDRYSRRSPSPPYDSEYGASPPPIRGYSPYQDRLRNDRREYKRPQARSNGRNSKGIHSSGSENDSLGKINEKPQRKG